MKSGGSQAEGTVSAMLEAGLNLKSTEHYQGQGGGTRRISSWQMRSERWGQVEPGG
jgi:hypothetical protein